MKREEAVTTSIVLPRDLLSLLRCAAAERALKLGCRVSVSGVLADLIDANRATLKRTCPAARRAR